MTEIAMSVVEVGEDFLTVISMRCYSPVVLGAL